MKINNQNNNLLILSAIATPLGNMIALADDHYLYALFFADQANRNNIIKSIEKQCKSIAVLGNNHITRLITQELHNYFEGTSQKFTVPISMNGTEFQLKTWQVLLSIQYGQTNTYLYQAQSLHSYNGQRAIGNANGANLLSIIIPCHRIIRTNGQLGGYAGGLERKQWLLDHEKKHRFGS